MKIFYPTERANAIGVEFEIGKWSIRVGVYLGRRVDFFRIAVPENEDVHGKQIYFLWRFGFAFILTEDLYRCDEDCASCPKEDEGKMLRCDHRRFT